MPPLHSSEFMNSPTHRTAWQDPGTVHTQPADLLGENSPTQIVKVEKLTNDPADTLQLAPFSGVLVDDHQPGVEVVDAALPEQTFRADHPIARTENRQNHLETDLRAIITGNGIRVPLGIVGILRTEPNGDIGQEALAVTEFGEGPETPGRILGFLNDGGEPFTLASSSRTGEPRTVSLNGSVTSGKLTVHQQGDGVTEVILGGPEAVRQLQDGYDANWAPESAVALRALATFTEHNPGQLGS